MVRRPVAFHFAVLHLRMLALDASHGVAPILPDAADSCDAAQSLLELRVGEAHGDALVPDGDPTIPPWARGGEMWRRAVRQPQPRGMMPKQGKPQPMFWDAPTDHFAPAWEKPPTFRQKYFVDKSFYTQGGPVFFQLGGEGPVHSPPGGFIAKLAEERSALLVQVEHRFYGDSIPNGNVNASNLKLLTVDQALADYAGFIDWFSEQEQLPNSTKWFAFGGSYPGALASWFRIAYPDKTVGSLSSSGVVNSIFDFVMFDVHIARAIGKDCAEAFRSVTAAYEEAVLARGDSEANAKKMFGCSPTMSDGDFFYMLADGLSMLVQYGAKTLMCQNLTQIRSTPVCQIAPDGHFCKAFTMTNAKQLIDGYWGPGFSTGCFYDTACLSDPARYVAGATDRSWRWQKCYELAYLQSAPLPDEMQGGTLLPKALRSSLVNMTYMVEQCRAIFGDFDPVPGAIGFSTQAINARFGGAQPTAKNVFYSNFGDDPWLQASVMPPRDVDADQPYSLAMCDDCGHCKDLRTPSSHDPPEVQNLRARFVKYLDLWLKNGSDRPGP